MQTIIEKALTRETGILTEHEAKRILAAKGLSVTPEKEATSLDEALSCAEVLGYPAALKISSPAFPHKTDVDGVALGLLNKADLSAAWDRLSGRFPSTPLLVQRMASPGLEIIMGARRDPSFGAVVMAGLGGVFAEALKDVCLRICPVDQDEALAMLDGLKGGPILAGYRGRPAVDKEALAAFLVGLSEIMMECPEIFELECNPVFAHPEGAMAVDALGRVGPLTRSRPARWSPGEAMAHFFAPGSVAVIGASERPGRAGTVILRNLLTHGFRGKLYPVHPTARTVQGLSAYPTARDLPEPVDLAVAAVRREHIVSIVRDCGARRIPNLIVVSGGFADIGEEGLALEKEVTRAAAEEGVRIMGPNSIGTIDTTTGVVTSITTLNDIPRGRASYVGQTGVFASGFASMIDGCPGAGMGKVACLGNKADVCETDLLAYLALDEATQAVGLYLEGVKKPESFYLVLKDLCARKPVVVLKSGRSRAGAAAAATHTGALIGDDRVFDAALSQAGALRVYDFDEMFDLTKAFALSSMPKGNGLGVVSISGVGCVLAADHLEAAGVRIPALEKRTEGRIREIVPSWAPVRNPVDIWSTIESRGAEKAYEGIASAVLDQEDIHAILLIFIWIPESRFDLEALVERLKVAHPDKPAICVFLGGPPAEMAPLVAGLERIGVPTYPSVGRACRVIGAWESRRRFLSRPGRTP